MKKLILLVLGVVWLAAASLPMKHDLPSALKEAKKSHKEVLMIYSAPWCPECNYMKKVAFKNPKLAAYLSRHFVLVDLDVQKDELPKGFSYEGIPTFFLLDARGKEKGRIVGGSKAEKFLKKLKSIQ